MIIKFPSLNKNKLVFCIVDRTYNAISAYAKELVKNQADYTISNIHSKGYDILQGLDEDALLKEAAKNYEYAVVLSTGTEFTYGDTFFNNVEKLCSTEFFIAGHILDRKEAYYELHHQCYVINLSTYKELGCPDIGKQELGSLHIQQEPMRSIENIHDDYTPTHVVCGFTKKQYLHKMHGWNILSLAFNKDLPVKVFNESIRNSKLYLYPETQQDFNLNLQWIHKRSNYCSNSFIHKETTDLTFDVNEKKFKQLLVPASGFDYSSMLDSDSKIIFYDYNKRALAYWKERYPDAGYLYLDLLGDEINLDMLDKTLLYSTLINVSNIFCYEGTSIFADLQYRLFKENQLLSNLKEQAPDAWIHTTSPSWLGFKKFEKDVFQAKDFKPVDISELTKPTWHCNNDWINQS